MYHLHFKCKPDKLKVQDKKQNSLTFKDQRSHHTKTYQLICSANQLTSFCKLGTLVVKRLKHFTPETHLVKILSVTGSTMIGNKVQGSFPTLKKLSISLDIFGATECSYKTILL